MCNLGLLDDLSVVLIPRFAVIGQPISHSLSPQIHQAFARQLGLQLSYERIEGDAGQFEQQVMDFFAQGGRGMNVTLPFKHRAYQMAVSRSPRCDQAGAANTLWWSGEQLCADNTDGIGLVRDLKNYCELAGQSILVVGAGGATAGILGPLLAEQPRHLYLTNRSMEKVSSLAQQFPLIEPVNWHHPDGDYDLIINATAASLAGTALANLTPAFRNHPFCYDLAYDRQQATRFVQQARSAGCEAVDGLGMLIEQAAEAFYIWHGQRVQTDNIKLDINRY